MYRYDIPNYIVKRYIDKYMIYIYTISLSLSSIKCHEFMYKKCALNITSYYC